LATQIQAIRGMNDILPEQTPYWQQLEEVARGVLISYGYEELRLPLLEKTELFSRSIGEVTDIVEKEMYTFSDRNGDSLTLRPEGTAGCVRAGIQNGLLRTQQRLWYMGPMFRHERPQKGRYRQFHQIGVEVYGLTGPDVDAEHILICARIWRLLGLEGLTLELSSLGSVEARAAFRARLVEYFSDHLNILDEDSRRRLSTNPLRILDSKHPDMQALIRGAPSLHEHLDGESREHFEALKSILDAAGIAYAINPRLVRGLDYYTRTVFEWTTERLGAQGTVCAGGRYDGLVEQLGGKPTPAVGFAMGLERMVGLMLDSGQAPSHHVPHAYLAVVGDDAIRQGQGVAERLRNQVPWLRLLVNGGGGSFKTQMKRADKCGARVALVLGDEELQRGEVGVKHLRDPGLPQSSVRLADLGTHLSRMLLVGEQERGLV